MNANQNSNQKIVCSIRPDADREIGYDHAMRESMDNDFIKLIGSNFRAAIVPAWPPYDKPLHRARFRQPDQI